MNKAVSRVSLLFCTLFTINLFINLNSIMSLRPSSDDYCLGSFVGKVGFIQRMIDLYNGFSGFVFVNFIEHAFIGLPLVYLDWSFASSFSYVLTFALSSLPIIFLLNIKKMPVTFLIGIFLMIPFAWWVFLWSPEFFAMPIDDKILMAHGLTHWQNINVGYILPIEILFAAVFFLHVKNKINIGMISAAIITGMMIGTSGTTLSLSFTMVAVMAFIYFRYLQPQSTRSTLWFFLLISSIAGLIISHGISPGHWQRQLMISPRLNNSIHNIRDLIRFSFITPRDLWINCYISKGSLLVFSLLMPTAFLLYKDTFNYIRAAFTGFLILAIYSLMLLLLNRLAETFSYVGYWHNANVLFCIFLSVALCALGVGAWLASLSINHARIRFLLCVILFFGFIPATFINLYAADNIKERKIRWDKGPAPLTGIVDIELENGWAKSCWIALDGYRSHPTHRG